MKLKTMSKFLLCFLIIGFMASFEIAKADVQGPIGTCNNNDAPIYKIDGMDFCWHPSDDTDYPNEMYILDYADEHESSIGVACGKTIELKDGYIKCSDGFVLRYDEGRNSWVHDETEGLGESCPVKGCTGTITIKYNEKYCMKDKNYIESFLYYGVETWQHARYSKCFDCSYDVLLAKSDGKYYCPKTTLWVEFKEYKYVHTDKSIKSCENGKEVRVSGDNMMCECRFYVETGEYNWWHIDCDTCGGKLTSDKQKCRTADKNVVEKVIKSGVVVYIHEDVANSESTTTVVGGPAASYFFAAGNYEKAKQAIDNKMSPLLHIQSLIMLFGTLGAVIVGLIYGIQWAMATPNKRQELKAGMWPLVIGITLLVIGPRLAVMLHDALKVNAEVDAVTATKTLGGSIINVIQTLGYVIAVIMMLIVAIQWFTAVPNKRQELKARMVNLTIGAIIIVSCTSLLNFIYTFASSFKI